MSTYDRHRRMALRSKPKVTRLLRFCSLSAGQGGNRIKRNVEVAGSFRRRTAAVAGRMALHFPTWPQTLLERFHRPPIDAAIAPTALTACCGRPYTIHCELPNTSMKLCRPEAADGASIATPLTGSAPYRQLQIAATRDDSAAHFAPRTLSPDRTLLALRAERFPVFRRW